MLTFSVIFALLTIAYAAQFDGKAFLLGSALPELLEYLFCPFFKTVPLAK